ncbi:SDR family oxidoreductase [Hansschlegelia quercus]|uniref:SDR family oxidoreductase n=1 Tax=Hansschlegelia quercus TaxID=2528245 RepID=A0A4Q9GPE9_9HYPH|nr:SDR family oxidoreductase [Hansschlegelia quercus]TBN55085.1 SDR family oxidoreductase [Hansschlegelia quercus]
MRALVLGAYGLIGSAVADRLIDAGWDVVGLGRSIKVARRLRPEIAWRRADIATLLRPNDWTPFLDGVDAVVNCAGALQDGARDDVAAVQRDAMTALYAAAEAAAVRRFVQISAVGARPDAATRFMRTKGEADAALAASRLDWTILRPGLVIGPAAYGGTALLRGLANFPLVAPVIAGDALIQTIAVEEVAEAVHAALAGRVASCRAYDLVEDEAHSLDAVVAALRAALGRPPARALRAPRWLGRLLFDIGDLAGRLGWRPPMRTAALLEIEAGVRGDPDPWRAAGGRPVQSLATTLRRLPSTVQERWFGRLFLLKPAITVTLALFWMASGAIGLMRLHEAAEVLLSRGANGSFATSAALLGALIDLALGAAILVRRTHVAAAWGMIAVTALYLAGATLFAPDLWLDPLGPLLKAFAVALLALVALAIEEER